MPLDVRIRRLDRHTLSSGVSLIVPALEIDVTLKWSAVSALGFTFQRGVHTAGSIPLGTELAVELFVDGAWIEPEMARFIVTETDTDEALAKPVVGVTAVQYHAYFLSKARMAAQTGAARLFKGTAGTLLRTGVMAEPQARGWAPEMTFAFTPETDSSGRAWAGEAADFEYEVPADQTSLATLDAVTEQGVIRWTAQGRELLVYSRAAREVTRPHTFIGRRRKELQVRESIADAVTHMTVRDDDGVERVIKTGGASGLNLGTLEGAVAASGAKRDAEFSLVGQAALASGSLQTEFTVTEDVAALDSTPFVHYQLGDTVQLRRWGGAIEPVRVTGVQLRKSTDASVSLDLLLQDRIASLDDRLAKRAASLGISVGGNGRAAIRSGGAGGGGSSVRYGTVAAGYTAGSGNPAWVVFTPGAEPEGPFPLWQRANPIGSGDYVAVVDGHISDRILQGDATPPDGTTEPLAPFGAVGEFWVGADDRRYGPLSIHRTDADWVQTTGVLKATVSIPAGTPIVHIPVAHQPEHTLPLSTSYRFDAATGNIVARNAISAGQQVNLSGFFWNIQRDNLMLRFAGADLATIGGVDKFGMAFTWDYFFADAVVGGTLLVRRSIVPSEHRPPIGRNLKAVGSVVASVDAEYVNLVGDRSSSTVRNSEGYWWPTPDYASEWVTMTPINGYTRHPEDPFQATLDPSGRVWLRGRNNGGGVNNQSVFILPEHMRPQYEVTVAGTTITPSGAVFGATNSLDSTIGGTFMARPS